MTGHSGGKALEVFHICRDEIKHELDALNGRLSSYITSQSFLVTAFAVSMGNPNPVWGPTFRVAFPVALSLVGIALSIRAQPGILDNCERVRIWHSRQDQLLNDDETIRNLYNLPMPKLAMMHRRDLAFAQAAPMIFLTAWILFFGISVWMHKLDSESASAIISAGKIGTFRLGEGTVSS